MATGQQSRDAATSLTSTLKQFAKSWIPPALWCQLRYLRHGDEALYEYLGPYWPKDAASETGWDDAIAVETAKGLIAKRRALATAAA